MKPEESKALADAAALVETVHIALQAIPDPTLASLGRCLRMAHYSLLTLQIRTTVDESKPDESVTCGE